jgi:hypothetical protein
MKDQSAILGHAAATAGVVDDPAVAVAADAMLWLAVGRAAMAAVGGIENVGGDAA